MATIPTDKTAPTPSSVAKPTQGGPDAPLLPDAPLPTDAKGSPPVAQSAKPSSPQTTAPVADVVVRESHGPTPKDSPLRDLVALTLPADEGMVDTPPSEVDAHTANVTLAMVDIVKGLFDEKGLASLRSRMEFLGAHPEQGLFTEKLAALKDKLPDIITQLSASSTQRSAVVAEFGEPSAKMLDAARSVGMDLLVGRGATGVLPSVQQIVGQFVGAATSQPPAVVEQTFATRMTATPAALAGTSPGGKRAFSFADASGKLDPKKLGQTIGALTPSAIDACLEYFINLSSRLVKGDFGKDLEQMESMLAALKGEKQAILGRIQFEMSGTLGTQMSGAAAAKEAAEANRSSRQGKIAGSIIALIIAVIVAIVVTVFTFGAAAPAGAIGAAAAAGAVAGALGAAIATTFAVSASVAIGLAISVVVALIVVAIVSFATTIADIIEAVAMTMEDLGYSDAAKSLFAQSAAIDSYMESSGLGKALMIINIVASLYAAIIMLPLAGANLANVAGQAARAAVEATQYVLKIVSLVQAIGMLVTGAVAIAGSVIAKDVARLNRVMDEMRARLAEIDVEIKGLLQQINEKREAQTEVKDAMQDRQEMEQRIMDNLNKAADSYSQILKAVQIF